MRQETFRLCIVGLALLGLGIWLVSALSVPDVQSPAPTEVHVTIPQDDGTGYGFAPGTGFDLSS